MRLVKNKRNLSRKAILLRLPFHQRHPRLTDKYSASANNKPIINHAKLMLLTNNPTTINMMAIPPMAHCANLLLLLPILLFTYVSGRINLRFMIAVNLLIKIP